MTPNSVSPITFFFPYHEISGVPMLFSRMAAHLAGRGVDVRVIDYSDGAMAGRLDGVQGVELIPFHDGEALSVGGQELLVMQSILPATIRTELCIDAGTRMLFWTLHPANLMQAFLPIPFFRDLQLRSARVNDLVMNTLLRRFACRLRDFVSELVRKDAIVFMDGETLRITSERLRVNIPDPVFVPVPSESVSMNRAEHAARKGSSGLSFGWLGRLSDFKIHILVHTLERASELARRSSVPMEFHIIGAGPDASLVQSERLIHENFRIVMPGSLTGTALDDYLTDHVDVLAAMGTSALEGARLGIPTVLLDISYAPVRAGYRFHWLHDTKNYTLGEVLGPRHFSEGNDSLENIVRAVLQDRAALSRLAFEYYRTHHAIDVVADRFLAATARSRFTWGDIDPELLRKGLIRRVYERIRETRRRQHK